MQQQLLVIFLTFGQFWLNLGEIWLDLDKIWEKFRQIWLDLDNIKILHQKHLISYSYANESLQVSPNYNMFMKLYFLFLIFVYSNSSRLI